MDDSTTPATPIAGNYVGAATYSATPTSFETSMYILSMLNDPNSDDMITYLMIL